MKKRIIGLVGLMVLTANLFAGQIFYVTETGAGNKDGSSWANAYADVQNAIDAAANVATSESPSEVWIAKGTYKHGSAMAMKNNVAIYGGFAGTETSKEQRVAGNATILDGEGKYRVFDNNYTEEYPLTNSAKLDNVTIQNGYTSGDGAGMYNDYASPEITNCTFTNNSASGGSYSTGGGMYNGYSSPTLINCTFANNRTVGRGGGMYNDYSNPTLTNCTFSGNGAYGVDGYYVLSNGSIGGGMYNNYYSSPTLTNCILWGNTALRDNEIYNDDSNNNPTIDTCIIENGRSGIYNSSYCTFTTEPITSDPKLMPLGNYGGSVPTYPVGAGSSAIGAGKVVDNVTTDARGFTRSSTPTIGAYEYFDLPTIDSQPTGFGIFATSNGSLSVSATGKELTYQWYFNGEAIEGATESTLSFENIQTDKAGSYYCVITNPAGSVTTNKVNISVKPTATIITQPTGFEVLSNIDESLSVSATGEELTYQWYKVDENGNIKLEGETSSTLSFDSIQTSATGSYYCVITNPAGSVQSATATVTVRQSATEDSLTKGLEKVTTVSGTGYARFVVETIAYNPTFKWYYGSDSAGWTEFEETSNKLFIPAESKYNRKNIKCEISNGGGSVSTQAVLVYNSTAIQITSQPQDVSCKVNNEVSFNVIATISTGKAFYQWQYSANGDTWENIENATDATYTFKMQDFTKCGYYRCEIDNGGGVLYSEKAKLSGVISIISQPQDVSAFAGNPVEFTIDIGNVAGISYQWQVSKDNGTTWENITDATSTTYSTTMSLEMNNWQYRCKFSVSGLEDTFSNVAKLMLLEDVAITTQPVVVSSAIIGTKATFTVVISGDDPKYQWQVSYDYGDSWENITGATNASLNVDVVANITDNSYRCLVWNDNNVDSPLESEMVWIENATEPTAFQKWSIENGLGADASPSAIPHNDGITNLEKFAFGLDASKATSYDANASFKHTSDATGATLEFPISVDAEGVVQVKALKSTDLINWTETTATATGETSSDGKFKIYKATAPVGEDGKVFLKLQVEEK